MTEPKIDELLARLESISGPGWDLPQQAAAAIRELKAEQERRRLIEAQHARLCDEVYEDDGETLKIIAERKAREDIEHRVSEVLGDNALAVQRAEAAEAKLREVEVALKVETTNKKEFERDWLEVCDQIIALRLRLREVEAATIERCKEICHIPIEDECDYTPKWIECCRFIEASIDALAPERTVAARRLIMGNKAFGLYNKFIVTRMDGRSDFGKKHHGCEYFVLDLDHDSHAPAAIRAYAESCREEYPMLSADLFAKFPAPASPFLPSEEDTNRAYANALERVAIIKAKHSARKAAELLTLERAAEMCKLTAETIMPPQPYVEKHWYGNVVLNDIYVSLETARKEQCKAIETIIRAEISRLKGEGRGS